MKRRKTIPYKEFVTKYKRPNMSPMEINDIIRYITKTRTSLHRKLLLILIDDQESIKKNGSINLSHIGRQLNLNPREIMLLLKDIKKDFINC